jgi:hypothetical protein
VKYAVIRMDHIELGRDKAGFNVIEAAEASLHGTWQECLAWSPQSDAYREGFGLVRVEHCPPGTPAGPDPDRAEMLLAEGLANYTPARGGTWLEDEIGKAFGLDNDGNSYEAPWAGAYDQLQGTEDGPALPRMTPGDGGDSDAYAAGAALAMALEDA